MSKFSVKDLWNERYGKREDVYDYAGRPMKKSACRNQNSSYQPTIDHIRPLADGGKDVKDNITICHYETNADKGDSFPHWTSNGKRYHAKKIKNTHNGYEIVEEM